MVQLYRKSSSSLDDLIPCPDSLTEVLAGDHDVVIYQEVDTGLPRKDNRPFALHVPDHDRGFGDWDKREYYEIDSLGRRIFLNGSSPFRHLDKTSSERKFFIREDVTIQDFITAFREAGYEILNRTRRYEEL